MLHTTARDAVASGESPLRLGVDPSPPPVWGQRKLVVVTVLMAPPFDKSNHGTKATRWAFQDHSPFVGLFLMVPSTLFMLKPFMIAVMLSSEGSKMGAEAMAAPRRRGNRRREGSLVRGIARSMDGV